MPVGVLTPSFPPWAMPSQAGGHSRRWGQSSTAPGGCAAPRPRWGRSARPCPQPCWTWAGSCAGSGPAVAAVAAHSPPAPLRPPPRPHPAVPPPRTRAALKAPIPGAVLSTPPAGRCPNPQAQHPLLAHGVQTGTAGPPLALGRSWGAPSARAQSWSLLPWSAGEEKRTDVKWGSIPIPNPPGSPHCLFSPNLFLHICKMGPQISLLILFIHPSIHSFIHSILIW